MADDLAPSGWRWAWRGCCVAGLLGAVACEQLPWSPPSSQQPDTATAALTTAQSAATPVKPAVLAIDVLATVNNVPISKADFELRLQELKTLVETDGGQWQPLSPDQREAVLDELLHTELMSQDAVARGLDRSLDTQRRWEYLRRGFFAQEWLRWSRQRLSVKPEEVEQYYDQNAAGFRVPARLRLRQLVVASEDQAKRALAQLHTGSIDFATLAQQISLGPTAAQGGLLAEWVMRANDKAFAYASEAEAAQAQVMSLDPVLEAAAFAIDEASHISNYVKGADERYHIFQLVERQEERQREKAAVWDEITNFLTIQKLQAAIDELRGKATLEQFTDRLEGVTP